MSSQEAGTVVNTGPLLGAIEVGKSFDGKTWALAEATLTVQPGEIVCIIGANGSGKTTLLRCLNLLCTPSKGRIVFHDEVVGDWPAQAKIPAAKVRDVRTRVAMVFQHFELFPHLSAMGNVALGPRHVLKLSKQDAQQRAMETLTSVGLAKFANKRPGALSGGQKQRVAIARALAMTPEIILFDEPTSALDREMVEEVLGIMATLAQSRMTMVIVTHELNFARQVATRVVTMDQGRVIEDGPADVMFTRPQSTRSQELLRGGDSKLWQLVIRLAMAAVTIIKRESPCRIVWSVSIHSCSLAVTGFLPRTARGWTP